MTQSYVRSRARKSGTVDHLKVLCKRGMPAKRGFQENRSVKAFAFSSSGFSGVKPIPALIFEIFAGGGGGGGK